MGVVGDNPYEDRARIEKAYKIADQLAAAFAEVNPELPLSDIAETATDDLWIAAAARAGKQPPSDTTKELVIKMLKDREAAAITDPFDGLDQNITREVDQGGRR